MPHPFASLGPAIVSALGGSITVYRYPVGSWNASSGLFENDDPEEIAVAAVVQPTTPTELEQLPEGERTHEAITLYTVAPLKTASVNNGTKADLVVWSEKTYEVRVVEDWSAQAQYGRAVAVRISDG